MKDGASFAPLSWWASVRLVGWDGRRASRLELAEAVHALRRGLRGRRRREALVTHVARRLHAAAAPETALEGGRPAWEQQVLLEELTATRWPDPPDAQLHAAVAALARRVAYGPLLETVCGWLGDHHELAALHRQVDGRASLAFVDLEIDGAGAIVEAAVLVRCPVRGVLVEMAWTHGVDVAACQRLLQGTVVVAHNGDAHDLPRLRHAGVQLPPRSLDTLWWARLADPAAASHGQLPLLDDWGIHVDSQAHTAAGDVAALVPLFDEIRERLQALDVAHRSALAAALRGAVDDHLLALMLDPPEYGDGTETHGWQPSVPVCAVATGSTHPDRIGPVVPYSRQVHEGPPAALQPGQILWVRRLRDALDVGLLALAGSAGTAAGRPTAQRGVWRVAGCRCLDGEALAGQPAGGGWPVALGIRLVDATGGLLDVASAPLAALLEVLPRMSAKLVDVGEGPVQVTDAAAMALAGDGPPAKNGAHAEDSEQTLVVPRLLDLLAWPPAIVTVPTPPILAEHDEQHPLPTAVADLPDDQRSTVIEAVRAALPDTSDALILAGRLVASDDGSWRFVPPPADPARIGANLIVHGAGVSWSRRELTALLHRLLGTPPQVHGRPSPVTCEVQLITDPPPRGSLRTTRRLSDMLAVLAADNPAPSRTRMLLSPVARTHLPNTIGRLWRERLGAPLLRPPHWPTLPETAARMRRDVSFVAAPFDAGLRLLRTAGGPDSSLIVDGLPHVDTSHPVAARLLRGADDAFAEVIEPVAALRLLELAGQQPATMVLADVLAVTSPLLRAIEQLTGRWSSIRLDDATDGPHRDAIDATFDHDAAAGDSLVPEAHLRAAVRRLLPDGAQPRSFQTTVLGELRDRHDVLAVFRTGLGKSLCYQAPGVALADAHDAVTVIVSPLIALQHNQLAALHARGVWQATLINSRLDPEVVRARLRGLRAGFYRIVLCAPEALIGPRLRNVLRELPVRLLAIDEAHVISELGHDFRPDYRQLPGILRRLVGLRPGQDLTGQDRPVVLALTGTASPDVQDDITRLLDLPLRTYVDGTFVRDELRFSVWDLDRYPTRPPNGWTLSDPPEPNTSHLEVPGDDHERLRALLSCLDCVGRPVIVYAPTQRATEQLAAAIGAIRPDQRIAAYHAGIDEHRSGERLRIENAFLGGELDVLVATNAFGMGVDKGDVQAVVHWATPATPEALYQEAGRAGRALPSGEHAWCVLLHRDHDLHTAARIRERGRIAYPDLQHTWATLEAVAALQPPDGPDDAHATHHDVLVTDQDLEVTAGLDHRVQARTVLAHLERAGMLTELERGLMSVHLTVQPDAKHHLDSLSPLERDLLDTLPAPGQPHTVRFDTVLSRLPEGSMVDLATLHTALRGLQRHGAITIDRQIGILLQVTDPQVEARHGWDTVRMLGGWLHRTDWFPARRWGPLDVSRTSLDLPDLLRAVEVLSAEGCTEVARATRHQATLRVRRGRNDLTDLKPISESLPTLTAHLPATNGRLSLHALAERAELPAPLTLRLLTVLHLLGVIQFDSASWQFDTRTAPLRRQGDSHRRRHTAPTLRQLRLSALDDVEVEARLRQARRNALDRAREDELKRTALLRYTELDADDDANAAPRQRYLEAYFTDRSFLDDLVASQTGRLLDGLDPDQTGAVTADGTTLRIVAGPGTGKTHTLTRRVAYRLHTGRSDPATTIALAYNRAAGAQLAARLAALGVTSVRATTLHALARRIVLDHFGLAGYPEPPKTITGDQRRRLLPAAWRTKHREYLELIDRICNAGVEPDQLPHRWQQLRTTLPYHSSIPDNLAAYRQSMREANQFDHAHSILFATRIAEHDTAGALLRAGIEEVYIDEIQDIAPAEMYLVLALAREARLTVVGDQRQAIYGFKLADPQLMGPHLDSHRDNVTTLELTYNYRSRPAIIDAANHLAPHIAPGLRPLKATRTGPATIARFPRDTPTASHDTIAGNIQQHLADGVPDNQIVVLARGIKSVTAVSRHLRRAGLTVRTAGLPRLRDTRAFALLTQHTDLIERQAAQHLEQLRVGAEQSDADDPETDGIPEVFLDAALDDAVASNTDVADNTDATRDSSADSSGLGDQPDSDPTRHGELPDDARALADTVEAVLRSPMFDEQLASIDEQSTQDNLDDRDRLIADLHERIDDGIATLPELIQAVRAAHNDDDSDAAGITVSTAHKAKGLEWDVVIIADATSNSWYSPDLTDEMQRLFYVAITRARHTLELHWNGDSPYMGIARLGLV